MLTPYSVEDFTRSRINGNSTVNEGVCSIAVSSKTSPEVELMETPALIKSFTNKVVSKTSPEVELMETLQMKAIQLKLKMAKVEDFTRSRINGNALNQQFERWRLVFGSKTSPEVELMETVMRSRPVLVA